MFHLMFFSFYKSKLKQTKTPSFILNSGESGHKQAINCVRHQLGLKPTVYACSFFFCGKNPHAHLITHDVNIFPLPPRGRVEADVKKQKHKAHQVKTHCRRSLLITTSHLQTLVEHETSCKVASGQDPLMKENVSVKGLNGGEEKPTGLEDTGPELQHFSSFSTKFKEGYSYRFFLKLSILQNISVINQLISFHYGCRHAGSLL